MSGQHSHLLNWTKLPTHWIRRGGLCDFNWRRGGSDDLAALMVMLALANHMGRQSTIVRRTYSELQDATSLSRSKVSAGLHCLAMREIIERGPNGRSSYRFTSPADDDRWGKLPAAKLYGDSGSQIKIFADFSLRKPAELDAMKIYYLIVAYRDQASNQALLSYDKFVELAGLRRANISRGISMLSAYDLIRAQSVPIDGECGVYQAYRLPQIDAYRHGGTAGRTGAAIQSGPRLTLVA